MAKRITATLTNWFLPGLGYLILGKKIALAIPWLVGMVGLTYVEFGIKEAAPEFYLPMFLSVLVVNSAFAVDAWKESAE